MLQSAHSQKLNQVAPVLRDGDWVTIGYDSEIKLQGCKILHRLDGRITRHPLAWLVDDKPLLNWILGKQSKKNTVDVAC